MRCKPTCDVNCVEGELMSYFIGSIRWFVVIVTE